MESIQLYVAQSKQCSVCQGIKPLSEFSPNGKTRSGAPRYRATCRPCTAKQAREWRAQHPEHKTAKRKHDRKWRSEHREAYRASRKATRTRQYHNNLEQSRAKSAQRQREWREKNIERSRAIQAAQRARKRLPEGAPSFTAQEWLDLCARYGNRCVKCKRDLRLSPDHVIPIAMGGSGTIDNIQPLCHYCNIDKGTGTDDYRW